MRKYSRFLCRFWIERDMRRLSWQARFLFTFCFTNVNCGIAGLYPLDPDSVPQATGMPRRTFLKAWEELLKAGKIAYDETTGEVWVRAKFGIETEVMPGKAVSQKTIAAARRELIACKSDSLTRGFRRKYALIIGSADAPSTKEGVKKLIGPPAPATTATTTDKRVSAREKVDRSHSSIESAHLRKAELLARAQGDPGLQHLHGELLKLKPLGCFADTGKPVFHAPDRARTLIKRHPEYDALVIWRRARSP